MMWDENGVTFNGVHSSALNLSVLSTKRPLLPEYKDEYIDIPHKNGSFLMADKSAKDIMVEVTFLLETPNNKSFFRACLDVGEWLHTDGRKPLIFDDVSGYFYNAKVVGNVDIEQISKYGEFTITFRCEPYPKEVT